MLELELDVFEIDEPQSELDVWKVGPLGASSGIGVAVLELDALEPKLDVLELGCDVLEVGSSCAGGVCLSLVPFVES